MKGHDENWEKLGLKVLRPLDPLKTRTVGQIVEAMSYCSFGARCLGEVTETLTNEIAAGRPLRIVYDGRSDTALGRLCERMVEQCRASGVVRPDEFVPDSKSLPLIVGPFSERHADRLFAAERAIFINREELCRPGQVKDGYFPDVVFADPRLIMPILEATLTERIMEKPFRVVDLMARLAEMGGTGSQAARGAQTFLNMVRRKEATRFLTLSGAMTVAQMSLLFFEMIDRSWFQYVASTGALMAHGLVQGLGMRHYKHNPSHSDEFLAEFGLNRVTDSLEPESNLDHLEEVMRSVLFGFSGNKPISPSILHREMGRYLAERHPEERAILAAAFRRGVPVCVPAFVDSEIGNDLFTHNAMRERQGFPRLIMDLEIDSKILIKMMIEAEYSAIFSVGGGVPRNNTQNVAPLIEIYNSRLETKLPQHMFRAGCRIAPDAPHFGHLSGCTYSENMSWRKMDPEGDFSEVRADATIVLPFFVRYAMDNEDR